jgi:hypothetical protein
VVDDGDNDLAVHQLCLSRPRRRRCSGFGFSASAAVRPTVPCRRPRAEFSLGCPADRLRAKPSFDARAGNARPRLLLELTDLFQPLAAAGRHDLRASATVQGGTRRKDNTCSSFNITEKTIEPSGFCEAKNSSCLPLGVRQIADQGKWLNSAPDYYAG